ncbi:MAG: hypothetical protein ACOCV3_06440 [Halanaerobiales bacterium]
MKKIFLFIIFLAFLFTTTTMAHPPQEVTAQFDLENSILSVEIAHNVGGGSNSHYIDEVIISLNGKEVIAQKTTRQVSDTQTFFYFMPAVEVDDEIGIVAVCNVAGQGSVEIIVEDKNGN